MKVGDYVRTKDGLIRKIVEIDKLIYIDKDYISDEPEYHNSLIEEDVIKTSPNIIDLIEVGDFITYKQGNIYWNIPERVSGRYNRQNEQTNLIANGTPLEHLEILTIVTKEQFESMEYKVGE